MTLFMLIVFLHLLSAFGLFIGYGLEWTASSLLGRSTNSEQAHAWLRVYRVSPPLSGASLGIVILSGGYLASAIGAMKQGWIPVSLIGIVIAVLLGIFINVPRMRATRKAVPEGNEPLSSGVRALLQNPLLATSVRLRTMLAIGIVFLMTVKLPFVPSLDALALSLVIGLLLSLPVWFSKSNPASSN